MMDSAHEAAPSQFEDGRSLYSHRLDVWLLDALDLSPGCRVLELASGAGDLALLAAIRVRPGGAVICSDLKPARVAEAARKAIAHGATVRVPLARAPRM